MPVVAAVHGEPSGAHEAETFERGLHPVLLGDVVEHHGSRGLGPGGKRDELAHGVFVRRRGEVDLHLPGERLLVLERGGRCFGGVKDSIRKSAMLRAVASLVTRRIRWVGLWGGIPSSMGVVLYDPARGVDGPGTGYNASDGDAPWQAVLATGLRDEPTRSDL